MFTDDCEFNLEQKFSKFGQDLSVTDGTEITGYASFFDQTDNGKDVVAPGAYAKSLDRLAKSDRTRQSIIRHAFRYFLGRNETLSDSRALINADKAYRDSNGSFDEVIVSLLTSDSFIYRKPIQE